MSSFDDLSYEQIKDWMTARLFGVDAGFAAAPGDMPHYLIALLYPEVSAQVRDRLEKITFDLIADLAYAKPAAWLGSAGEELLLLVDPILLANFRRERLVDNILRIVTDLSGEILGGLLVRALQALVALDYHPSPRFWTDQYRRGGREVLPIVLEGLARADFTVMLDWIATIGWTERIADIVVNILPFLFEGRGVTGVRTALAERYSELPPYARDIIEEFCLFQGFSVAELAERLGDRDSIAAVEALLPILEAHLQGQNGEGKGGVVTQALSVLGRVMPKLRAAESSLVEGGRAIWDFYARCLRLALQFPESSPLAFEQLISQLPPPEALEVTRLVLRERYVDEALCKNIILRYYDPLETNRLMKRGDDGEDLDVEFEAVMESIASAFMHDVSRPSLIKAICIEDDKVSRSKAVWIDSLISEGRVGYGTSAGW